MNQNNMTKTMKTKDEVLILYVNDFEPRGGGLGLDGHLQKGRVYLCLKHEEEEEPNRTMYRIFFDDSGGTSLDGIFIHDLKESNDSWRCDLEELDFAKIDKYRLSDDDVNYVIDIKNMSLEEVRAKIDKDTPKEEEDLSVFERLDQAIVEDHNIDIDDVQRIYNEAMDKLGDSDEEPKKSKNDLREVFDEVIEYIGTTFDDKYDDSMINMMSMLTSDEHGKTLNVFNAAKYLSRYHTDGFEKSNNPKDLMKAIHYILIEMNRVKTNLK